MPIKGLTEQQRLPRLGKIRLGLKVAGDRNPYPRPVNYFVCPDAVKAVYGDRPKELCVLFPSEEPGDWASQFYRCHSASRGLVCKGDGEKAMALVDEESGALAGEHSRGAVLREVECDPARCPRYGRNCRRVMKLRFLLPDVPGLGVWQMDTSSYWSICNVNSGIRLVKALCGRIALKPLTLRLSPREVYPDGRRKVIYVLSLDVPGTVREMMERRYGDAGRTESEMRMTGREA